MRRFLTATLGTALLLLGLSAAIPSGNVFAAATQDNPASSSGKANCNSGQNAAQIPSGKNKGKWYCISSSNNNNGGLGGGGCAANCNNGAGGAGGGGAAGGGGGAAAAAGAAGSNTPAEQAACSGLDQLGGTSCGGGQSAIGNLANNIVKIISYIAGIIAVIMVIVSGIRYTTSGGDSAKVGAAKSALVYALVGVAIVALTQFLIHFVLTSSNV